MNESDSRHCSQKAIYKSRSWGQAAWTSHSQLGFELTINVLTHIEDILLDDLLLPGDGDGPGAELGVEVLVRLVQADSLHRGELLDVQNILTKNILLMLML